MIRILLALTILAACNKKEPEPEPAEQPVAPPTAPPDARLPFDIKTFDPKKAPAEFVGCPDDASMKEGPDRTYRWCEKNGKRHGPEMQFASGSPDAKVLGLRMNVDGVDDVMAYSWDSDGDLEKVMPLSKGRGAGVWIDYKKGVPHGRKTYWTTEGQIEKVEIFRDGQNVTLPDPVCPAGTKLEVQRKIDLSWEEVLGGEKVTIDRAGWGRAWCIRAGKPHGPYVYYGTGLVAQQTGTFVNGVEHGKRTVYHDTGELTEEGTMTKGAKTGTWINWWTGARAGKKRFEEVFDQQGKRTDFISYEDDGNPKPKRQ